MNRFKNSIFFLLVTISSFVESIERKYNSNIVKYLTIISCGSGIVGIFIGHRLCSLVKEAKIKSNKNSDFEIGLYNLILVLQGYPEYKTLQAKIDAQKENKNTDFSDNEYLNKKPQSNAELNFDWAVAVLEIIKNLNKDRKNKNSEWDVE